MIGATAIQTPTEGAAPFRLDCDCRKPRPGLLRRAASELGLDLLRSTLVGDKPSDLVAARAVGARGVLVLTGYGLGEWEYRRAAFPVAPNSFFIASSINPKTSRKVLKNLVTSRYSASS